MIYFIMGLIGFFTGGFVSLVMYSTVVSKRTSDLVFQNAALTFELEKIKKKNDLLAYRCMYASDYDGFEETK